LQSIAIKRLLSRALWEQGIRHALAPGVKRHEWKGAHGYRKAFKTRAEQFMLPANVEILMGHDIGVSESYWRPTENEVLQDYLKAIPSLSISGNSMILEKQIEQLTEKSREENYIIKGKLSEKEQEIQLLSHRDSMNADAIATLSDQLAKLIQEIDLMKKQQGQTHSSIRI
jgi:hypothetical protein